MRKLTIYRLVLLICIFATPGLLFGQEENKEQESIRQDAVRIFIDCQRCDMNYIREEITYVNYVRDVREAQVYILETRQGTGSGGNEYTFTFLGQNDYLGENDTLVYSSAPDEPGDRTREARTQMLRLGLMKYVAKTPLFNEVNISHGVEREEKELIDKWNYWVFELETRPRFELEETKREVSLRNSISITKINEDWKVELGYDHSYNREKYFDDDTVTYIKRSQGLDNLIVRSLGEHWSAGIALDISSSTFNNTKLGIDAFPSIEYNIFPYSQATRRQLRFLYGAGYSYNMYNDSTIYNKMEDKLFQQKLEIAFQIQQKWGSVNLSMEASNYFHDWTKNRFELDGSLRVRIFKGLSLQLNGGVALIHDQLSLEKGDVSDAERLLDLKELQTAFTIDGSVGITYTFGSIYNNIVNPRFGGGRGYGGGGNH
jgi:hypothetical protein